MRFSKTFVRLFYLLIILFLISSCGNKRSPTGGPQDIDKPVILECSPAEYGDISSGIIEISFSKPMDRNTLANSIYIYPPVQNKKITLDGANLKIQIKEQLQIHTNYFITLTKRLKDLRGNTLEKNQTLIFRNGNLATNRIAGTIDYEESTDKGLPIELSLLSSDSLLVLSGILYGGAYAIDNLNPQKHILRTYIDKNQNGRYDFGLEPYFEGITSGSAVSTLNLSMAYSDSTIAKITKVNQLSNRELQVIFSEEIKGYNEATLQTLDKTLPIAYQLIEGNKVSLLTAKMDNTEYTLTFTGVKDKKDNLSPKLETIFKTQAAADTLAPVVTFTQPRNGASVNTLLPVLEIHFNEIIPTANIQAKLLCNNQEIPLKHLSDTGRIHRFQPQKELENYKSHILLITTATTDFSGNHLPNNYELQFLPLLRKF
ncbi:MAG TPA: Ig-like domain-containing protein [Candidatus Cloacimonas sp.]|nr:Ig-like domain-containing protein [Candidatus Cloacimonas sp.]